MNAKLREFRKVPSIDCLLVGREVRNLNIMSCLAQLETTVDYCIKHSCIMTTVSTSHILQYNHTRYIVMLSLTPEKISINFRHVVFKYEREFDFAIKFENTSDYKKAVMSELKNIIIKFVTGNLLCFNDLIEDIQNRKSEIQSSWLPAMHFRKVLLNNLEFSSSDSNAKYFMTKFLVITNDSYIEIYINDWHNINTKEPNKYIDISIFVKSKLESATARVFRIQVEYDLQTDTRPDIVNRITKHINKTIEIDLDDSKNTIYIFCNQTLKNYVYTDFISKFLHALTQAPTCIVNNKSHTCKLLNTNKGEESVFKLECETGSPVMYGFMDDKQQLHTQSSETKCIIASMSYKYMNSTKILRRAILTNDLSTVGIFLDFLDKFDISIADNQSPNLSQILTKLPNSHMYYMIKEGLESFFSSAFITINFTQYSHLFIELNKEEQMMYAEYFLDDKLVNSSESSINFDMFNTDELMYIIYLYANKICEQDIISTNSTSYYSVEVDCQ